MTKVKYSLRRIVDSAYHGGLMLFFDDNSKADISDPTGHSYERKFSGGDVVCRADREVITGLAKVVKYDKTNRPIRFGEKFGQWVPPKKKDKIKDLRARVL